MTDRSRAWLILIHAHDHVWRNRRIPLAERAATCALLFRLSLQVLR